MLGTCSPCLGGTPPTAAQVGVAHGWRSSLEHRGSLGKKMMELGAFSSNSGEVVAWRSLPAATSIMAAAGGRLLPLPLLLLLPSPFFSSLPLLLYFLFSGFSREWQGQVSSRADGQSAEGIGWSVSDRRYVMTDGCSIKTCRVWFCGLFSIPGGISTAT